MQSYDVVIAGGGMVGLALACGLHGCGLRIAVIEKQAPDTRFDPQAPFAVRVSAINSASERLLGRLGVWQDILAKRAAPYQGMEVWDNDSFGRIAFSAAEAHCEHLGHIIENDVIRNALWERVQTLPDVTLLTGTQIRQVVWGENDAFITLENDDMLTTRLVAGQTVQIPGCVSMRISWSRFGIMNTTRWSPPSAQSCRMRMWRVRFFTATAFWHFCRCRTHITARLSGLCLD